MYYFVDSHNRDMIRNYDFISTYPRHHVMLQRGCQLYRRVHQGLTSFQQIDFAQS